MQHSTRCGSACSCRAHGRGSETPILLPARHRHGADVCWCRWLPHACIPGLCQRLCKCYLYVQQLQSCALTFVPSQAHHHRQSARLLLHHQMPGCLGRPLLGRHHQLLLLPCLALAHGPCAAGTNTQGQTASRQDAGDKINTLQHVAWPDQDACVACT